MRRWVILSSTVGADAVAEVCREAHIANLPGGSDLGCEGQEGLAHVAGVTAAEDDLVEESGRGKGHGGDHREVERRLILLQAQQRNLRADTYVPKPEGLQLLSDERSSGLRWVGLRPPLKKRVRQLEANLHAAEQAHREQRAAGQARADERLCAYRRAVGGLALEDERVVRIPGPQPAVDAEVVGNRAPLHVDDPVTVKRRAQALSCTRLRKLRGGGGACGERQQERGHPRSCLS